MQIDECHPVSDSRLTGSIQIKLPTPYHYFEAKIEQFTFLEIYSNSNQVSADKLL